MSKRLVQYRCSWQALRVSMLAEYNELGGFATEEGTLDNIGRMTNYLLETIPFSTYSMNATAYNDQQRMGVTMFEEHQMRMWRVLNMCNAVRMGYSGQGLAGSKMDAAITAFRGDATINYNSGVVEDTMTRIGDEKWWQVVRDELVQQAMTDPIAFFRVQENLQKRWDTAFKKGGTNTLHTRSELHRYIELMDDVLE